VIIRLIFWNRLFLWLGLLLVETSAALAALLLGKELAAVVKTALLLVIGIPRATVPPSICEFSADAFFG
jgi:hypothetical protein